MLATLKSLVSPVVYWTAEGEKYEEECYKLLGFEEVDMYAIGRHIRHADEFSDNRDFRKAFKALCKARPWFQGGNRLEGLREEWRALKDKKLTKKERKATVVQRSQPEASQVADDSWEKVSVRKKGQRTELQHNRVGSPQKDDRIEVKRSTRSTTWNSGQVTGAKVKPGPKQLVTTSPDKGGAMKNEQLGSKL